MEISVIRSKTGRQDSLKVCKCSLLFIRPNPIIIDKVRGEVRNTGRQHQLGIIYNHEQVGSKEMLEIKAQKCRLTMTKTLPKNMRAYEDKLIKG